MPPRTIPAALANFDNLPDSAFVDVRVTSAVVSRSPTSIWRDSARGNFPRPVKLGPACTRWNVGDIRRHLARLGASV